MNDGLGRLSRKLPHVLAAVGWLACGISCSGSGGGSLIELYDAAVTSFDVGTYPSFAEDPEPVSLVDIEGDVKLALTPPFPGRILYDLRLPPSAFLEIAPALVTTQLVRRARVSYSISVEHDGVITELYSNVLRLNDANAWNPLRLDLRAWSEERVRLVLETEPVPERSNPLWADRVQTVWGEPLVISSRTADIAATARQWASSWTNRWVELAGWGGLLPEDIELAFALAINMLLGGLLSIGIRELYKSYAGSASNREAFARTFPMFTLVTILVITIVQASLALSLGLIGALSIVRFRSAVKNPEDIVYLLFNISVGLALGANQRALAVIATLIVAVVVVLRDVANRNDYERAVQLTLSGDAKDFFDVSRESVLTRLGRLAAPLTLQRCDQSQDHIELRVISVLEGATSLEAVARRIRDAFPNLRLEYVDLDEID